MAPSFTSGLVASSRLGAGSRSRVDGRAPRLAPARMSSAAAPTGTSAHGPGNCLTPSMSAPQDSMANRPTPASRERSHIGQSM